MKCSQTTLNYASAAPTDYDSLVLTFKNILQTSKTGYFRKKLNDARGHPFFYSLTWLCSLTQSDTSSICLGTCNIQLIQKVRDLGFLFDSELTMKQHVIKICQATYLKLNVLIIILSECQS